MIASWAVNTEFVQGAMLNMTGELENNPAKWQPINGREL
jgi:hypothetical protein